MVPGLSRYKTTANQIMPKIWTQIVFADIYMWTAAPGLPSISYNMPSTHHPSPRRLTFTSLTWLQCRELGWRISRIELTRPTTNASLFFWTSRRSMWRGRRENNCVLVLLVFVRMFIHLWIWESGARFSKSRMHSRPRTPRTGTPSGVCTPLSRNGPLVGSASCSPGEPCEI